jgi:hypothetical protein
MSRIGFKLLMTTLSAAALSGVMNEFAAAQHSDIEIEIDGGAVVAVPRLVEAFFGEDLSPPFSLSEPGFEADDGALAPDAAVSIMLPALAIGTETRSLWHWDGMGSPAFGPSPHQLKVTNPGTATSIQVNGVGASADFGVGIADMEGGLHQDLVFDLVDAGGTGIAAPTNGVYLWGTTVKIPGNADAPPIYWLAGSGVDEAVVEQAVDYAAGVFGVIPEPSSIALAILASGLAIAARPRRPPSVVS